jgi:hypothetical protein
MREFAPLTIWTVKGLEWRRVKHFPQCFGGHGMHAYIQACANQDPGDILILPDFCSFRSPSLTVFQQSAHAFPEKHS